MSIINYFTILIRGDSEILEEFARIFDHEYYYKYRNDELDPNICGDMDGRFVNSNCYLIDIDQYYQEISNVIDLEGLINNFPSLRFDCLDELNSDAKTFFLYLGGSLLVDYWGDYETRDNYSVKFLPEEDKRSFDDVPFDVWINQKELKDEVLSLQIEDFPNNVPDNSRVYDLKVVNQHQEIVAYFYRIGFILKEKKFSSPEAFCAFYDQLFEDYVNWYYAGLNPECKTPQEQQEDYRRAAMSTRWDPYTLSQIEWTDFPIKLMGLYRLAYAYHCNVEKVKKALLQIDGYLRDKDILKLEDIQVLRVAYELE